MDNADLGIEYPCQRYDPDDLYRLGLCMAARLAAHVAELGTVEPAEGSAAAETADRLTRNAPPGSAMHIARTLLRETPSDPEIISCFANHVAARCLGTVCGLREGTGSLD